MIPTDPEFRRTTVLICSVNVSAKLLYSASESNVIMEIKTVEKLVC